MTSSPTAREVRREETRTRIAAAARGLFAARGFERVSVRDVARAAGVDPALVLHYYGSKRELFEAVLEEPATTAAASPESDVVGAVLAALRTKIDSPSEHSVARMRSMLTHPDAAEYVRRQLHDHAVVLAGGLAGPAAQPRAALLLAMNLGIAVAREMLQVEALTSVSPAELVGLVGPAAQALAGPGPASAPGSE
jgi:AcrR family transcriptional regulator